MKKAKIVVASDHAGFKLKEATKSFLQKNGYEVLDVGAHEYVEGDDYPVYMKEAALKVAKDLTGGTKGIIFGGSGEGEAMVANRFPGVRATVWYGETNNSMEIIRKSREHNDANVLAVGARFANEEETRKAVSLWLETPFSGAERHKRRIAEIDHIETSESIENE
jgi:ribose 5-phosphate isomerase B